MNLIKTTTLFLLISPSLSVAQSEADFQGWLCSGFGQEVATGNQTSADCVIQGHAVEIDWSGKWAEAIGQSLFYAQALDLPPAVVLVCKPGSNPATCYGHALRFTTTATAWSLPIRLWTCPALAREISDCERF